MVGGIRCQVPTLLREVSSAQGPNAGPASKGHLA